MQPSTFNLQHGEKSAVSRVIYNVKKVGVFTKAALGFSSLFYQLSTFNHKLHFAVVAN
jgi:hypothetical protein